MLQKEPLTQPTKICFSINGNSILPGAQPKLLESFMMSHFVTTPANSSFKIPLELHHYCHHPGLSQRHSPLDYCCDFLTALPATTCFSLFSFQGPSCSI